MRREQSMGRVRASQVVLEQTTARLDPYVLVIRVLPEFGGVRPKQVVRGEAAGKVCGQQVVFDEFTR
jgi:hypothetical protein